MRPFENSGKISAVSAIAEMYELLEAHPKQLNELRSKIVQAQALAKAFKFRHLSVTLDRAMADFERAAKHEG